MHVCSFLTVLPCCDSCRNFEAAAEAFRFRRDPQAPRVVIRSNRSFRFTCSLRSIHCPAALILLYAWIAETTALAVTSTSPAFSIILSRAARMFRCRFANNPTAWACR